MSWVQFQDEVWPVTKDEADLQARLCAPEVTCPKVSWALDFMHNVRRTELASGEKGPVRWLSVDLAHLPPPGKDWRAWSDVAIRADAAWHERNEHFGEYGDHHLAQVTVCMFGKDPGDESESAGDFKHWVGHDFVLRFGKRDGLMFPCELDAWLWPKEKYERKTPELATALKEFGKAPPNLRVITNAIFCGGSVSLPRLGDDPTPEALRRLRKEIDCRDATDLKVQWNSRYRGEGRDKLPTRGWRSTVDFTTTQDS